MSSFGGMDLEDGPSACWLSPTVPDLCCFARMPWHLPDTIVPSCLKRWKQCGRICKEVWDWDVCKMEIQSPTIGLYTIRSYLFLYPSRKRACQPYFAQLLYQLNYIRNKYCVPNCVSFLQYVPIHQLTTTSTQLLSNLIHALESDHSFKRDNSC